MTMKELTVHNVEIISCTKIMFVFYSKNYILTVNVASLVSVFLGTSGNVVVTT